MYSLQHGHVILEDGNGKYWGHFFGIASETQRAWATTHFVSLVSCIHVQ